MVGVLTAPPRSDSMPSPLHTHTQREEDELREFELLEQAAQEASFSSQSSLVSQTLNNDSLPPPTDTPTHPVLPGLETLKGETLESAISPLSTTTGLDLHSEGWSTPLSTPPSPSLSPAEVLDETLKALPDPGIQFNDEEPWESFSLGSPRTHPSPGMFSSLSNRRDRHVSSDLVSWSSPVRREQLDQCRQAVFTSHLPASSINARPQGVPTQPATVADNTLHTACTLTQDSTSTTTAHIYMENAPRPSPSHLPPPSALVSKLFPALRREREDAQRQAMIDIVGPSSTSPVHSLSSASAEDSGQSTEDSGKGSMVSLPASEELRQKLCQLETEIERFRAENAALQKLREEKEKVRDSVRVHRTLHSGAGSDTVVLLNHISV